MRRIEETGSLEPGQMGGHKPKRFRETPRSGRAQWTRCQGRVEAERLVFIDESWTRTEMAPLWGWAPRGHRLPAEAPHGRWTMTFLAAFHDRVDARWLTKDHRWRELSDLCRVVPLLRLGDIVALDNLRSHRSKAVHQLIRSVGAKLFFPPK
ncbi:transposase [Bradyrhizobium yuanmingense]|uniref:transposase n=1 Tax=Bradyrhizobium yuanmingense TaxID=108015 RepID=UPI003CC6BDCD